MSLNSMYFAILLILSFSLLHQSYGYHILVSSLTLSYGEWSKLLHISKELLSTNDHFITFMIAENQYHWLDTLNEYNFNKSSYQILYTPSENRLTGEQIRDANKLQKHSLLLNQAFSMSFVVANKLIHIFSTTQSTDSNQFNTHDLEFNLNNNLNIIYNSLTSLNLHTKIDVCLLGELHPFGYHICDAFNIPTVISTENSFLSQLEYHQLRNSWLYFLNPWTFQSYANMRNGTIMSYSQRWENIFQRSFDLLFQWYSYFTIKPMLNQLNEKMDTVSNATIHYKNRNSFTDLYNNVAIVSSLGPPYSTIFYMRPRIKQFGFIIYPPAEILDTKSLELMEWLNMNNKSVLYIAMGSYHSLSNEILPILYNKLINHSAAHNYRVLWALRQNIYENITNEQLETNDFKIRDWVYQLKILQHENIKIFMTHCGGNSIVEGLYSKKAMILYPQADDQFYNGKRVEEVEAGIRIKDRKYLSDLTDIIDTLLLDPISSKYYENKINILHKMLSKNGGVSEAAEFVEYAADFGVKHLFCTLGNKYDCDENVSPWYQRSMIDVWIIIIVMAVCTCKFCFKLWSYQSSKKQKTE